MAFGTPRQRGKWLPCRVFPSYPNGLGCFDICCHEGMWVISQFTYWKYFKLFLQATKCNISSADLRYVLKLLKAISSEIEVCNLYSACRAVSLTINASMPGQGACWKWRWHLAGCGDSVRPVLFPGTRVWYLRRLGGLLVVFM